MKIEASQNSVKMVVNVPLQGKFEEGFKLSSTDEVVMHWPLDTVEPILKFITEKEENVSIFTDEKNKGPYLICGSGVELIVSRWG